MKQGILLLGSNKFLPRIALALFTIMVLLSPRAYAADPSGACGTSTPPTPYSNGAPIVRVFYPADGSTVTVTSTGAVIKQSPCQTPYREGWVNPADICNLNEFSQLSGMINQSDSNPNPNTPAVHTCISSTPINKPVTTNLVTPVSNTPTYTVVQTNSNSPAAMSTIPHPVVESAYTTAPSTALPNTGPSGVLAIGGISAALGTVGHFFYRRRVTS